MESMKYLSLTPYVMGLLSVSAILHESIYYSFYGINLLDYIEAGEALTLFVSNIYSWLYVATFFLGVRILMFEDTTIHKGDFRYRLVILAVLIASITMYNVVLYLLYPVSIYLVFALAFYIAGTLFHFHSLKKHSYKEIWRGAPVRLMLMPILLWLVVVCNSAMFTVSWFRSADSIALSRNQRNRELVMLNGDTVRNGKGVYILGKTNQYIFLRYKKYSKVIKIGNVKEFIYPDSVVFR